jgi:hypothetical protein
LGRHSEQLDVPPWVSISWYIHVESRCKISMVWALGQASWDPINGHCHKKFVNKLFKVFWLSF